MPPHQRGMCAPRRSRTQSSLNLSSLTRVLRLLFRRWLHKSRSPMRFSGDAFELNTDHNGVSTTRAEGLCRALGRVAGEAGNQREQRLSLLLRVCDQNRPTEHNSTLVQGGQHGWHDPGAGHRTVRDPLLMVDVLELVSARCAVNVKHIAEQNVVERHCIRPSVFPNRGQYAVVCSPQYLASLLNRKLPVPPSHISEHNPTHFGTYGLPLTVDSRPSIPLLNCRRP